MKPLNTRQAEHHKKMIEAGFKKRSFYVSDESIKLLTEYKEKHGLNNLHEAINAVCRNTTSK